VRILTFTLQRILQNGLLLTILYKYHHAAHHKVII